MRPRSLAVASIAVVVAAATCAMTQVARTQPTGAAAKPNRVFEIRTYTTEPGKLDALHARFRDHTNRLFTKHGIEMVGYWTVNSGEGAGKTLVFVLAYPSKEEHAKRWKAFAEDAEWKKAKEESEKGGALVGKVVNVFMDPTDYSPVK